MEIKIMSNYLERELDVMVNEITENGEKIRAITHDSLERIINDQLDDVPTVEYQEVLVSKEHTVIKCIIEDSCGRKITAIGESTLESLETPIARMYPSLIAYTRAFDRAAIRYLQFPTKMMSCEELNVSETNAAKIPSVNDNKVDDKPNDLTELGNHKLSIVGVVGLTISELYNNNREKFDNIAENLKESKNEKFRRDANKIREYKRRVENK